MTDLRKPFVDTWLDVGTYGLEGEATNSSTILGYDLGPPVLNISAFNLESLKSEPSLDTLIISMERKYHDPKKLMGWAYANNTYKWDDLQQRGKCQAVLVCNKFQKISVLY